MTLSLATRGYLGFRRSEIPPPVKCGPGPVISGTVQLEPNISGATVQLDDPPTIISAGSIEEED